MLHCLLRGKEDCAIKNTALSSLKQALCVHAQDTTLTAQQSVNMHCTHLTVVLGSPTLLRRGRAGRTLFWREEQAALFINAKGGLCY